MSIIREDIVSIGFEVGEMPFAQINADMDDMKAKITDGTNHSSGGFKNLAKQAGSALGTSVVNATKAMMVGVGAATTAVSGLVMKSTEAYAEYEQLAGGVETLFKDSAPEIQKYANDAYKTAGLTANEYMETVTSFSASLLQSLGGDTKKAASYADLAITDMSDNANKMGTDMELIQNAYQGFAKGNYTMLDNLKLGYGGTKEEMARLVKDAAKVDNSIDANSMSYANIVKAIHAVQDNMGITGTTALEAEKTISGSLAGMKSAWGNLLTSLVQGGDSFDQNVANLVNSVKTFASNVIPVAKSALSGIVTLINELAPVIIAEIPALLSELLPQIVNVGMQLMETLMNTLSSNAPMLGGIATQLITALVGFILSNLPQLITTGMQLLVSLVEGISQQLPTLIPMAVMAITTLVTGLIGMLPQIISAGVQLIVALVGGLAQALPQLIGYLPEICGAIVNSLKEIDLIQVGKDLIGGLIKGISSMVSGVIDAAKGVAKSAANAIKDFLGINSPSKLMIEYGNYTGEGLVLGVQDMDKEVAKATRGLGATIDANVSPKVNSYTPSSSGVSTTNNRSTVNNFNPQFTLNMNGASATESNKRKIKKWVKESIQETFESIGRVNPELCEV